MRHATRSVQFDTCPRAAPGTNAPGSDTRRSRSPLSRHSPARRPQASAPKAWPISTPTGPPPSAARDPSSPVWASHRQSQTAGRARHCESPPRSGRDCWCGTPSHAGRTRPRLPVRPGDAAARRSPSVGSHERVNSKRRSGSLAGIARTAVTVRVMSVWAVTSDASGRSSGWRRADSRLLCRLLWPDR